jgi:hypothetical protein
MAKRKAKEPEGELSLIPGGEGFTELSRLKQGRLFEKHILTKGPLIHPVTKSVINIDDDFVNKLKKNFDNKVCDIVQVPLAGDQNQHVEAPERNLGEVVDIKERDGKVYAVIDARKNADDFGKTLLGASAMLHTNYVDTRTGKAVGPTLLHVAVTNRPYVVGLEDYKEVLAASQIAEDKVVVYSSLNSGDTTADNSHDKAQLSAPPNVAIQETTMSETLTLESALEYLKAEHGIDVPALQASVSALETDLSKQATLSNDLATSLSAILKDTESVELSVSEGEAVPTEVIVGAIAELANTNKVYHEKVANLERAAAVTEVNGLVSQGRVLPTQVDSFVELKLTNPSMFDSLVPSEPVVKMNTVVGSDPKPEDQKHKLNIDEEVARLSSLVVESNK